MLRTDVERCRLISNGIITVRDQCLLHYTAHCARWHTRLTSIYGSVPSLSLSCLFIWLFLRFIVRTRSAPTARFFRTHTHAHLRRLHDMRKDTPFYRTCVSLTKYVSWHQLRKSCEYLHRHVFLKLRTCSMLTTLFTKVALELSAENPSFHFKFLH